MQYYLYRHIRLDKNEPFYIGIGSKIDIYGTWKKEFYRAFNYINRNNIWKGIVSRTDYEVDIMYESDNYDFIKEKEKEFIALYGRIINGTGTLCNLTEGGEDNKGYIKSEETKYKISEATKGEKHYKSQKCYQYNSLGNLVTIYPSFKQASVITTYSKTVLLNSAKHFTRGYTYFWSKVELFKDIILQRVEAIDSFKRLKNRI